MTPRYHLRCLGQPALLSPSGEPIRIRTKKHLALLVYLAVEPQRSHRRDELAALLWPKHNAAEARHSLSTALSMFRARLGRDAVVTTRETIALKPNRLTLDLDRLLNRDIVSHEFTSAADVAGFLGGFDIGDAPEFAHWKDRQQARLLPAIKRGLISLIDQHRRNGQFQQIDELADRMLAMDDLSEEAIQAKMEARALSGDRITALRVYEDWRTKLASDLQALPSDALQQMAEQLRGAARHPTKHLYITSNRKDQQQTTTFVGRTAEYRSLYEGWEQLRNGTRTHLFLVGESGVGKTTLVQRLAAAATLEGAIVSRVQCYDIEQEIPYSLVSTIIVDLLDYPGALGTAPEALAELAKIAPEIRRRFPSVPTSLDTQGEAARIRLTEALLELLAATAEEKPVLLVVDDFHFADHASLAVLHLIIRRATALPIAVAFVTRPGELRRSPHALRLRTTAEAFGLREIELRPLTSCESEALLDALVLNKEPRPNRAVRRVLLTAAAGYPMILELLVQDWQAHGDDSLALSINAMTKHLPEENAVAATYRNILQRVTLLLQPAAQKALNLAAILGHRLNDLQLYSLVALNTDAAANALSELEATHLLRDSNHNLEFKNELIRSASYLAVPTPVRTMLHRQIADRLIDMAKHSQTSLGLETAWHCIRGGREKDAIPHLLTGASDALNQGAIHQAEHALATALSHLEGLDRERALILLVEALQDQGRWEDSLTWLSKHPSETPSELRTIFTMQANHFLNSHSTESMNYGIQRLIEITRTSRIAGTCIKAVRVASRFLPDLRDKTTSLALLHCIDSLSLGKISDRERIELSLARALCLYYAHQRDQSLTSLSTDANRYRATGTINSTLWSLMMGLGAIKCQQGKYEEGLIEFKQAYEVATRIGNDASQDDSAAQVALCCCRLGRYDIALEWTGKIRTAVNGQFSGYVEIQQAYYSGLALASLGKTEQALTAVADLDDRLPHSAPSWLVQTWHLFKADVLYLAGEHQSAVNIARDTIGYPAPVLYSRFFAGIFARWLALTANSSTAHQAASSLISELVNTISTLDAIDQVEVTCAAYLINYNEMSSDERVKRQNLLRNMLNQLPQSIQHQLQALGVLYP